MAAVVLLAFLIGAVSGATIAFVIDDRIRWRKPAETCTPLLPFRLPWQAPKKPEAKKPAVNAIPRNLGSWRRQKRELERQHNSRQKERDQRMASL